MTTELCAYTCGVRYSPEPVGPAAERDDTSPSGDFCYTDAETALMAEEIRFVRQLLAELSWA